MSTEWLLFIYTLPSQPSRKRAYVWRELKKLGAVYIRDGVAILPQHLEDRVRTMVVRVEEYEGTADLILGPRFAHGRDAQLVSRFKEERAAEYREVYHSCVRFLRDVLEEVDADMFGFPDVDKLESELHRLRRWKVQIEERDYFDAPGASKVNEILDKCDRAFENFVSTAHARIDESRPSQQDDVFERLGGRGPAADGDSEAAPL